MNDIQKNNDIKEEEIDKDIKNKDAAKLEKFEENEIKGFSGFLKSYSSIIKAAVTILFANIVFSLLAVVTIGFENSTLWVGIILYVLFFISHAAFLLFFAKGRAYSEFSTYRLNNLNKKAGNKVVRYKKMQEYKPYKGYIIGAVASIPLILMMIISLFFFGDAYSIYTGFIKFLYSIFLSPIIMAKQHVAFGLFGIIVNVLAFGASYHFFGIKMQIQQEMIENEMKELHKELDVNGSDNIDV